MRFAEGDCKIEGFDWSLHGPHFFSAAAPLVLSVLDDPHRDSGHVSRSHELGDSSLDLGALFRGELVFLGLGALDESSAEQDGYHQRVQAARAPNGKLVFEVMSYLPRKFPIVG